MLVTSREPLSSLLSLLSQEGLDLSQETIVHIVTPMTNRQDGNVLAEGSVCIHGVGWIRVKMDDHRRIQFIKEIWVNNKTLYSEIWTFNFKVRWRLWHVGTIGWFWLTLLLLFILSIYLLIHSHLIYNWLLYDKCCTF